MPGTRQYMAPENIVRPEGAQLSEDLSETDLSKVDTFALGVILVNMLTGSYLFPSCLSEEYLELVHNFDQLLELLRKSLSEYPESELYDLALSLNGMLHPDPDQRLSISDLED